MGNKDADCELANALLDLFSLTREETEIKTCKVTDLLGGISNQVCPSRIGHSSLNQSVMLILHTCTNRVPFMQFHKGEIYLL